MAGNREIEDPRRRWLIQALGAGAVASAFPTTSSGQSLLGSRPQSLAAGQNVYRVTGRVFVNGQPADTATKINPGDQVRTDKGAEIILAVGGHAMIVRENSDLTLGGVFDAAKRPILNALRLLTGRLLSVSRNTRMSVNTPTATVGIRGTGWYAEAEPDRTYFCTCYGATDITSAVDPNERDTVQASRHDRPLYILSKPSNGNRIISAPFINHTDQELMLIEALVGRSPPFVFSNDAYDRPRRDY